MGSWGVGDDLHQHPHHDGGVGFTNCAGELVVMEDSNLTREVDTTTTTAIDDGQKFVEGVLL